MDGIAVPLPPMNSAQIPLPASLVDIKLLDESKHDIL
jgi:hypothetical protein